MCFLYGEPPGIGEEPGYLYLFRDYSEADIAVILRMLEPFISAALVEEVLIHKNVRGHKKSLFSQGYQSGLLIGMLRAYQIPFYEASAKRWKEHTGVARRMRAADKDPDSSISSKTVADDVARRRFPNFARTPIRETGDAILIAEVARTLGRTDE